MEPAELLELFPVTRGRPCRLTPLEGGLTNRNFLVDVVDSPTGPDGPAVKAYVLRLAGTDTERLGIDRRAEVACARAAAAVGLTPEVAGYLPVHGATLRPFVAGHPLTAEDIGQPEVLPRVVAALRRYHDSAPGAGRFCPFETIRSYHAQAQARAVPFPPTLEPALHQLAHLEAGLSTDAPPCPCHNDLLPANFIDGPAGLQIIDWEYAGMGDRFFDLGNLAVNGGLAEAQERRLLELYFGRIDPEHHRRLRAMRLVSDLREAHWGYLQAGLSELAIDYLAYGQRHLDRFIAGAREL